MRGSARIERLALHADMPGCCPECGWHCARSGHCTSCGALVVLCAYGNAPSVDCGARSCPVHGTPSASPYGKRQGARSA